MGIVLNFSHPLTDNQHADLASRLGEFDELRHPAQFDMEADSLRQQVYELVQAAVKGLGGKNITAIIPPSLSSAAYWLAQDLEYMGWHDVPAIWLRRESGGVPPKFVVGGIE